MTLMNNQNRMEYTVKDTMAMSQSIVTKELKVTTRFPLRVRAYLNIKKDSKRGQMCSTVIWADSLDFENIEEVHAFAAKTLAKSLGWNDTDLIAIHLNRLGKQNDSGNEMIWINKSGVSIDQILYKKSYWFDPEWPLRKKVDPDTDHEVEVSSTPSTNTYTILTGREDRSSSYTSV